MSDRPAFIKGRELCAGFYRDVVAPLVAAQPHSAALFGEGSEVLGLDTERSTDHAWGPRLQLFVSSDSVDGTRQSLAEHLPETYRGWPTRYFRWQTERTEHHIDVASLASWLRSHFGFDPRDGMSDARWLAVPQQLILEVAAGAIYCDRDSELAGLQDCLAWYPRDVWLWLMASQWNLLADWEHLVGRTAEVEDQIGARVITGQVVHHLMMLWFLQERQFAPYPKWLGSVFSASAEPELQDTLLSALDSHDHMARERSLCRAYELVATRHNRLNLTPPVNSSVAEFDVQIAGAIRPYRVINAERFVSACRAAIDNQPLKDFSPVGSIDQLTNRCDLVTRLSSLPEDYLKICARLLGVSGA